MLDGGEDIVLVLPCLHLARVAVHYLQQGNESIEFP